MPRKLKSREQLDAESAARHNARNAERFALWEAAGVLDQVVPIRTGEDVAFAREDRADYFEARKERTRRKAALYRSAVAELVTPAELAALDERRLRYPKGPEYSAEMFCTELSRLTGRSKPELFREFEDRVNHASDLIPAPDVGALGSEIRAAMLRAAGR